MHTRFSLTRSVISSSLAALAISALMTAGCTNRSGDAGLLAIQGVEVSAAGAASFAEMRSSLSVYEEQSVMRDVLTGRADPDNPLESSGYSESLGNVRRSLAARMTLMTELGSLYSALKDLADFDAKSEIGGSAKGVVDSASEFASVLNKPLPAAVGSLVENLAAAIAQADQNRRLVRSSFAIREALVGIESLLSAERDVYIAIREEVTRIEAKTAEAIFSEGVGRPHPVLRDILGNLGLEYDAKQINDQFDKKQVSAGLLSGLRAVYQLRAERRIAAQSGMIDAQLEAVKALVDAHEEFESGRPPSIDEIRAQLALLRAMAEDLKSLRQ